MTIPQRPVCGAVVLIFTVTPIQAFRAIPFLVPETTSSVFISRCVLILQITAYAIRTHTSPADNTHGEAFYFQFFTNFILPPKLSGQS